MRISDWSSDVCSSDLRLGCPSGARKAPVGAYATRLYRDGGAVLRLSVGASRRRGRCAHAEGTDAERPQILSRRAARGGARQFVGGARTQRAAQLPALRGRIERQRAADARAARHKGPAATRFARGGAWARAGCRGKDQRRAEESRFGKGGVS